MERLMIQLAAAGAGTLGFAMLYNVRGKKLFWAAFGGFLGWAFYDILHLFSNNDYIGCFGASMLLHLYAEWMARRAEDSCHGIFRSRGDPSDSRRAALPDDGGRHESGLERICGSGSFGAFVCPGNRGAEFCAPPLWCLC